MKIALGWKAHSGWAALVVLGGRGDDVAVVDRRRIELAREPWAKMPYHAAEGLEPAAARKLVGRGVDAAHRIARDEMRGVIERERARGGEVRACAVLVGNPMPDWSAAQILAVHFRMHAAEGALFRDALCAAAEACGLALVEVPEKSPARHAAQALGVPEGALAKKVAALGKSVGAPWGKDQKDAALAALVALGRRSR